MELLHRTLLEPNVGTLTPSAETFLQFVFKAVPIFVYFIPAFSLLSCASLLPSLLLFSLFSLLWMLFLIHHAIRMRMAMLLGMHTPIPILTCSHIMSHRTHSMVSSRTMEATLLVNSRTLEGTRLCVINSSRAVCFTLNYPLLGKSLAE
jgi:hypothetical protein